MTDKELHSAMNSLTEAQKKVVENVLHLYIDAGYDADDAHLKSTIETLIEDFISAR